MPIFNLYFKDFLSIENKDVCFCGSLDETTTASHFCGGDKPWNRNEYSSHFDMTYKEKYDENLNEFYKIIR